ncbi:MAG: short-chain dehydrogenase [Magnetovibrio sp.]|nr:short-chain dehydrogenase [Magnetovibrio sp.]
MPTVLITGANRGIGFEFARQYADGGWRVIATCRDPANAGELSALGGDIEVHGLDVTDHVRIQALAKSLERSAIDLLLSNAGVSGPRPNPFGGIDYQSWMEVLSVNAMSPLKLCECFVDHVARSDLKRIVAVTSKMGSIAENSSGGSYIYRSSKTALNAVMKSLSVELASRRVIVAVLHPGWVRTDMGGPGALIEARTSVAGMRQVIAGLKLEDSGGFFNYDGAGIPW